MSHFFSSSTVPLQQTVSVCLAPRGQEAHNGAIRSGTRYAKLEGGLSLADTQTGRYGRLCSRRRLCARRGADARLLLLWILVAQASPTADRLNPILLYNWVLDTVTGTGPIPPVTVSRVNAYSGGVLANCPRVYAICRPELG